MRMALMPHAAWLRLINSDDVPGDCSGAPFTIVNEGLPHEQIALRGAYMPKTSGIHWFPALKHPLLRPGRTTTMNCAAAAAAATAYARANGAASVSHRDVAPLARGDL